jgi:hypothetical protein
MAPRAHVKVFMMAKHIIPAISPYAIEHEHQRDEGWDGITRIIPVDG